MGIWHSSVYREPSICTFVSTKALLAALEKWLSYEVMCQRPTTEAVGVIKSGTFLDVYGSRKMAFRNLCHQRETNVGKRF